MNYLLSWREGSDALEDSPNGTTLVSNLSPEAKWVHLEVNLFRI
jgi:hypothetical protein